MNDGDDVGGEDGVDPDQELGGEERHRVLDKHRALQYREC